MKLIKNTAAKISILCLGIVMVMASCQKETLISPSASKSTSGNLEKYYALVENVNVHNGKFSIYEVDPSGNTTLFLTDSVSNPNFGMMTNVIADFNEEFLYISYFGDDTLSTFRKYDINTKNFISEVSIFGSSGNMEYNGNNDCIYSLNYNGTIDVINTKTWSINTINTGIVQKYCIDQSSNKLYYFSNSRFQFYDISTSTFGTLPATSNILDINGMSVINNDIYVSNDIEEMFAYSLSTFTSSKVALPSSLDFILINNNNWATDGSDISTSYYGTLPGIDLVAQEIREYSINSNSFNNIKVKSLDIEDCIIDIDFIPNWSSGM